MSLQGTFNTAVQAMNTQSHQLSNISTNIANTNTTAYKAQDTHFETLLNHIQPTDKGFFTVRSFDYRQVDKQGTIATTGRTFDLALNGRGFLVTNANQGATGDWRFTRDGALFGKTVNVSGTDLDGDGTDDQQDTYLTTADGSYVYGWAADADGNFSEANSLSSLTPVVYSSASVTAGASPTLLFPAGIPSKATTTIQLQANLSASAGGRQSVGLPLVDQDGNSRTLTVGFTGDLSANAWTMDMASLDTNNQPVAVSFDPPNLDFDGTGHIISPTDGQIFVEISDANGPQSFTLDLTKLTQLADQGKLTVQNIIQDGYIAGRLQNTYFNGNGVLIGSYSNHEVRNLYKLPIATFAADNNLEARNGNVFLPTVEAGEMQLSGLGTPTGTTQIIVGALEASNVDLADQFSKMIITQRAYSSAAKVLTTADEMTQAVRDLKR